MLPRQLVKAFITVFMFFFLATTSAGALDFFEDFNGAGAPPNHADYWYKMNEIYPTQSSWDDYIPGDGHVYITVDNSSSWGEYQGIGIGWIPLIGQRMEVRMKGAIVPGYVGFIFTYASSADEIDIELLADDTQGEGGVHDPYEWSDARFNTTDNGNNWNANFKGIVDDTGSKVSHYEDDTYHTYTIDSFDGKVVFYIDGVYQETCTWSLPTDDSEIILGFRDLDFAGSTNWSGTKTLTIDWLNVKEIDSSSPVAAADRYATDQNTPITISGSGILMNDTGSNLAADLVSDVAHGTLSLNANGSFTYTPDSGFIGEDHFVYFANDGTSKGESNAARVLLRVGQPIEWQKVDDDNANIAYSAGWGTYVGSGGYLNTEHWSETAGSTATFSFNGTQARYYGFKRNDLGKVKIYVDGTYITTLDLYSSTFSGNHMLFETAVLASGSHTLTVELVGTQNSSSSGFEANIDAFSWIDMGDSGGGDTTAPTPNPMTWAQTPYLNQTWPDDSVATMTAATASDSSGGIQYYFDCVEALGGGDWQGCEDSGWQTGSTFSDWYLTGNTYHYRVKARDSLGNETGWSAEAAITVGGGGSDADPATTVAYAPSGVIGQPIRLLVKAKDANGVPLSVGGDTVTANITGANSATPIFVDNNDGTYVATYIPGLTGTDSVSISLNGTELAASPLTSQISQGFQLKVMSFNVKRSDLYEWDSWRLAETINAILEAGADIVGTQEMMSESDLRDVANGVGFDYIDYSSRIASRYPIVDVSPGYGARIEVLPDQHVWVYNTHWGLYAPWDEYYLPYTALSGNYTEAEIIDRARHNWDERSGMTLTLSHITSDMAPAIASGDPVFLVGDFNEPSHLDWTQAAADAGVVPMKVNAPLSNEMLSLGFTDSFRVMRPDEVNDKAHTWTPEYDIIHDRIDFIHFKGAGVTVTDSQVVGENSLMAEYIIDPWPSDHRAVVSTFILPGEGVVPYTPQTIMTWVASYAIEASKAAVEANLGACSAKDGLTRIGLQFWLVKSDGKLGYDSGVTDSDVTWWTTWGATNGIKILLTVHNSDGGWNWDLARSAFADNRTTLVNSLVNELERLNLDGVDIDFEGIGDFESDRPAFLQFITELSTALKSRGKLLTVDTFPYIWNAPNINWWSDWVGKVDNIHSMGYEDLYEGGTDWQKYSYQQNAGITAGYPANSVLMGMPDYVDPWGVSSGRGTDALAHIQEVHYDLPDGPTGIAVWDLQLRGSSWQNSDTWCEIAALKMASGGGGGTDTTTWVLTPYLNPNWLPDYKVASMTATSNLSGTVEYYFDCVEAPDGGSWNGCEDSGWQSGSTFDDWLMEEGNIYHYRVKSRNSLSNETDWTAEAAITVGTVNTPPTADFSFTTSDLTADFTDGSSDSDGTISSWSWNFGDGGTSTSQNPSHTYAAADTYTVSLTVTDNDGATNSISKSVTVTAPPDTEAPSITAPANVSVEATGVTTPVNLGSATATDNVDPNPAVTNNAPEAFPVGETMVTWTATDASGNSASTIQTVTVTDTTAPTITAPADISVESSGATAVDLGTPTVSDLTDPNPTVTNNAPALFPLGTTEVIWTVTDTLGNSATATQTVIMTAPLVIHVGDLDATASGNNRWTATVTVTVHNTSDAAVEGVTVSGTWSDGASGSCVTDGDGRCSTARITKDASLTFTVYSLSLSNGDEDTYYAGANHDPDGDSDGTSITINKDGGTGDTTPPTITLLGENPVTITVGSTYDDAGATAYDNVDGDLTANIQTVSIVDTDGVGTYTVVYNVSDNVGNIVD
jgi:PKD repeat protein/endonuclease/exonuclease/phosphatase family metal-dependent hydrolase